MTNYKYYTNNSIKATTGLIAAYNCKPIGNTLLDISGNDKNATKTGTMVFDKKGIIGNPNGNFITANTLSLEGDFSISFRLKANVLGSVSNILYQAGSSTSCVWVYISGSNTLVMDQNSGGSKASSVPAIKYLGEEATFTITFVNSTHTITFYKNGQQLGTSGTTYNPSGSRTAVMFIGGFTASTIYNCKNEIQDIRFYNKILTTAEIKDYHNSFIQPTLIEDFSSEGADGQTKVPTDWQLISGTYKIGENVLAQGDLYSLQALAAGWLTSSGRTLIATSPIPQYQRQYFTGTCTAGKRYRINYTVNSISGGTFRMAYTSPGNIFGIISGLGKGSLEANCIDSTHKISIYPDVADSTINITIDLVTEIPALPTLQNGTKYLENVTAGVIAIPSQQAYGTWEFDLYKGADANIMYIHLNSVSAQGNSSDYMFTILSTEDLAILKDGSSVGMLRTAASYISINTWYRIKITRTSTGIFTVLIKGGLFTPTAGYDGWTLVSTTGGFGTNPVTDNTYTTSNYFCIDLDAGDRISNIVLKDGVYQ